MSDENMANREYTADTSGMDTSMPGSRIGGLGEMGGSLGDGPVVDTGNAGSAGNPADSQGTVTGVGTNQMLDVDDHDDQDAGDGTTGRDIGGYGGGYDGGISDEDTDSQGHPATARD